MDVKRFTEADYQMLVKWWEHHKHPVLPYKMLSPAGLIGLNDSGEPACASFIYFVANCDIAQIAWTTTNPEVSVRDRYLAVNDCVKGLIALAKHNNRTNIMCFSDSHGLNKIFMKNGLKELKDHKLLYGSIGVF